MSWAIEFYITEAGEEPISDFLDNLPRNHKAKAFWELDLSENNIVLLHGFIKKTDKIPSNEIETAKKRLLDYRKRCL